MQRGVLTWQVSYLTLQETLQSASLLQGPCSQIRPPTYLAPRLTLRTSGASRCFEEILPPKCVAITSFRSSVSITSETPIRASPASAPVVQQDKADASNCVMGCALLRVRLKNHWRGQRRRHPSGRRPPALLVCSKKGAEGSAQQETDGPDKHSQSSMNAPP